MDRWRPRSIMVVAVLMIIFGAAEVATGFSHTFFGLRTASGGISTYLGAGIGVLYAAAGLLVLTMRRRAACAAITLLLAVIIGRILMVMTGLYPVDTIWQAAAMTVGTAIVVVFALFLRWKKSAFR